MTTGSAHLMDAWQRLEWANGDGEALGVAIKAVAAMNPRPTLFGSSRTVIGGRRVSTASLIQPMRPCCSLNSPDSSARFLTTLAAALDASPYSSGIWRSQTDPALIDPGLPWKERLRPEEVEFPIFRKKAKYLDRNKVREFPEPMRVALEDEQPYNGKNEGLWFLQNSLRSFGTASSTPHRFSARRPPQVLVDSEPFRRKTSRLVSTGPLKHEDVILTFTLPEEVSPSRGEPPGGR